MHRRKEIWLKKGHTAATTMMTIEPLSTFLEDKKLLMANNALT